MASRARRKAGQRRTAAAAGDPCLLPPLAIAELARPAPRSIRGRVPPLGIADLARPAPRSTCDRVRLTAVPGEDGDLPPEYRPGEGDLVRHELGSERGGLAD
jgi:hypothetical protein